MSELKWIALSEERPPVDVYVLVLEPGRARPIRTNKVTEKNQSLYWEDNTDFSDITHWCAMPDDLPIKQTPTQITLKVSGPAAGELYFEIGNDGLAINLNGKLCFLDLSSANALANFLYGKLDEV